MDKEAAHLELVIMLAEMPPICGWNDSQHMRKDPMS